ncbi:beta strand repeat-containing protein [Spirosoma validum]|uniref:PKD domain-containing protein n=1 Tax=Spirosoma validum TaxID=2771355 RepID=A0A927GBD9_9BACT|nr:hypothetical protein [Spirosoma validum]MBD2751390.1 hypothetical protein [Spirosoma validum]
MRQSLFFSFPLVYYRTIQLFVWRIIGVGQNQLQNTSKHSADARSTKFGLRITWPSAQFLLVTLLVGFMSMGVGLKSVSAQTINVASIDQSRYPTYSLNGSYMVNALAKLTSTANFGAGGTVNHSLNITHTFGTVGSITAASLASFDVLFIGMVDDNRVSALLTPSETQAIFTWSQQPGKVVILAEQPFSQPLTNRYGYGLSNQTSNPTTPTVADATSNVKIFSGVFGSAVNISQAGTSQGFFSTDCSSIVLARNASGNPSIILDTRQRDVLVADTDYFTFLSGGMTNGGAISSDTDKAWANLWAWAVNEVITPGTSTNTPVTAFTVAATPSPGCNTGSGSLTFTSPIGTASNGQPFEYSVDGGVTYQASPIFTNLADGTYSIYARAASTCTTSAGATSGGTVKVNVAPVVTISANPGLIIGPGQSTSLTASGATSYTWSTGGTTAAITTSTAGVYSVTGTRGICSATASVTVVGGNLTNGPVCDNFVSSTQGLPSDYVNKVFAVTGPGSTTVYANTSEGPAISVDGGQTFTSSSIFANDYFGLTGPGGTTLYFSTYNGLLISTDGGQTFTTKTTADGLGDNFAGNVFAVGSAVYVATGAGLSISTNGGNTFTNKTTANGLGSNSVSSVYAVGNTVYALTGGGLSISTDGGNTFTNQTTVAGLGNNPTTIYAVGNTVFVATSSGLSISTNGGQTFSTRTVADGLSSDYIVDLQVIGNTVYAATDNGLSISTNGGNTFTNATNGLGSIRLADVYVTGNSIYLARQGGGVAYCSSAPVVNLVLTASATPSPVCVNSSVNLSVTASGGTAPYSYTWAAPAGTTLSATSASAVSATAVTAGVQTFTVTVADAGGTLTSSTTVSVTVEAPPTVSIAANPGLSIVQGQSTTLTASGATSYTWSTGATTTTVSTSLAGTYSVTGVTGACSATASVTVTVGAPAPVLANFAANPTSVCAGQPVSFSANVANAAVPFAYTLTNGSATVSGTSASSTIFSQTLTASGSGVQAFTLTVNTPGGSTQSVTSVTLNTPITASLTASGPITQSNPIVTLTATPGANSYIFGSGATQINNSNLAIVTTAGVYSVTLTAAGGCSSTASVTVVSAVAASPDLALLTYVRPSLAYGTTPVTVVVDVVELKSVPTNGLITVKINRDAKYNLTLPATATSVGSRPVQNSLWQLNDSDPNYYVLTTTSVVPAGDRLSFGLTGSMTPNATSGSLSISSVVVSGSGGETNFLNNIDADRIDYFQQ